MPSKTKFAFTPNGGAVKKTTKQPGQPARVAKAVKKPK